MARGGRTVSGLRVLPPCANFQEVVILPRSFSPRRLWVKHGLGIDAELVVMRASSRGAQVVRTWRTFDDQGHVTVGLELEGRPRVLLLIWSSHALAVSVIDWRLSDEPAPRPAHPMIDTALGDPLTTFECALAAAFGVSPGVVRLVADEAATRLDVGRPALLEWLDRKPWFELERSYQTIRAEVTRGPLPRHTSLAQASLVVWFSSAARAMQRRS